MSLRPRGMPTSNLVTLEDDGPYWKVTLQTAQDNRNYGEEEYDDYGEYGYYADPAYQTYPAERTSTHIGEARDKASRIPTRPPPRQKFEGVFPPPHKNQAKPAQQLSPKQSSPNISPRTSTTPCSI